MVESSDVFEKNYQKYCTQIAKIDFGSIQDELGIIHEGDRMCIPFFNHRYFVSNNGTSDESGNRPDYMIFVILSKYIPLFPDQSHDDKEWVSFKDFKKASHFTNLNYFSSDTERAVERHFSGRLDELKKACEALNGPEHQMEISYDPSMQFNALPRISLLLLFNDGDEEFPAKCTVLFQKHAEYYLDPESLAMTGACLAKALKQKAFS
jgi:Domain of unknown function (DUF3786)